MCGLKTNQRLTFIFSVSIDRQSNENVGCFALNLALNSDDLDE